MPVYGGGEPRRICSKCKKKYQGCIATGSRGVLLCKSCYESLCCGYHRANGLDDKPCSKNITQAMMKQIRFNAANTPEYFKKGKKV